MARGHATVDHLHYRNHHAPTSSSRPTAYDPSPPTWYCLSSWGCGVPHGAARTWRASRHPSPPRAHRAVGASRLIPGIPGPQPEELSLQEAAVAPSQRPAINTATQDRLPGQEPWWVEKLLKLDSQMPMKGPSDPHNFCLLGSQNVLHLQSVNELGLGTVWKWLGGSVGQKRGSLIYFFIFAERRIFFFDKAKDFWLTLI